jgi:GT2 family glycosyltransferase
MRADAILVLNPDIETNIKAITHLLDSLEQDSTIGAVAPLLRDHDGHMQTHYSCRRLPTLGSAIAELFFLHQLWPSNPWTRHYLMQDEPLFDQFIQQSLPPANAPYESRDNPCLVEQPAAACLMVRGIAFRRVGGFDQLFWPAWFEDVDFCKRLHQAGFTTALNGKAIVKHEGGYSKDIIEPAVYAKAWYTNQKRYWKKHYSTANYFIFRTLWGTALVVRGLISGLLSIGAIFQGLSKASSLYKLAIAQLSLAFCPTDKGGISRDATESKTNWGSRVKKSAIHLRKAWHILRDSEYRVLDREPLAPSVPFSKARKSNSPASQMAQPELNRVLASSLSGHGIVIGFLPENTRLKPNVRYDSIGKSEDFITDSAKQISDGYYDFVVGSSILQQSANPIKTLIEMHRITRSGGCIYITLDRTPERGYRTPIEHFLFEVEEHSPERQKDAQLQQLLRSSDISGIAAISHSQTATLGTKTKSTNLLSTEDLTQLIHWFNQRNTPLEIETGPLALQKSNALHYILRKG